MNNKLEKFIKDNREDFDSAELPGALWNKIETAVTQQQQKAPVIPITWFKRAAAAAVIIAVGLVTFKLINTKPTGKEVAITHSPTDVNKTNAPATEQPVQDHPTTAEEITPEALQNQLAENERNAEEQINKESTASQEVYYFTKLIQVKQKQIASIRHDSPELYDHFVSDYKKLDASYNELKEEIKSNPNKELLLEKMIVNLQLQIDLLNQQLKVVRQLNKIKKDKADEISKSM